MASTLLQGGKIKELAQHFDICGTKDIDSARSELTKIMCPEIDHMIYAALEQNKVKVGLSIIGSIADVKTI